MSSPHRRSGGSVEVAAELSLELGEGTVWDAAAGLVRWVDIFAGTVFGLDPDSGERTSFGHPGPVGAVLPRAGGGLVLGAGLELVAVDEEGGGAEVLAAVEPEEPGNRFNDCRVDPAGRLWCGTKSRHDNENGGALHRVGPDLRPARVIAGTGIANGLGWSPDGATMYFIDSPTHRVDAYEFDAATGALGGRRTLAGIDPAEGLPDGLAVDAEGGVWVAVFGSGTVRRFGPDGALEAVLELPVRNPSCPAFGGPDLATLYVTTAHLRSNPDYADPDPLAGSLFATDPGVRGRPLPPFAG
jgi:sugar lactone lactonase YvrE